MYVGMVVLIIGMLGVGVLGISIYPGVKPPLVTPYAY